MAKKGKVTGFWREGGKWHAGNLSELPEVQNLVARFRAQREDRGNVVMVRLSDDALARINQLVDSTLVASRSEGAAMLISAGIDAQKELFARLGAHADEIRKLKEQIRQMAMDALQPNR